MTLAPRALASCTAAEPTPPDAPVMRADGTVLDAAGHDPSTGLLYAPAADFGTIANQPTALDVEQALAVLREVVCDFPLVSSGFSCWVALLLCKSCCWVSYRR